MIDMVKPHGVQAGVTQKHFQARLGRGIPLLDRGQVLANYGAEVTNGSGNALVGICNAWSRNP